MSVSREKYEKAKFCLGAWHQKFLEAEQQIVKLHKELEAEKKESSRWKKLSEELPDSQTLHDIEEENKELHRMIKSLKKQLKETEEKFKDKIAVLERDKILSDGKIQQLEESRRDLQERYRDLREDYRETTRGGKKIEN